MKESRLDLNLSFDFGLLAIVSPVKDYRISWLINQALDIDLIRMDDLVIDTRLKKKQAFFSKFRYTDELSKSTLHLVSNKFESDFLLPEQKAADFLIILYGDYYNAHINNIQETVNSIQEVQLTFQVEPNSLKSKNNLLF